MRFGKGLIGGAILSFSVTSDEKNSGWYPKVISQQIEQWTHLFRLFKPTDLTIVYQSVSPVSIFETPIYESKERPQDKVWQGKVEHSETSSYKLFLNEIEEETLRAFIKNIKPALERISHTNYLSGSSYDLAFHRYNDSLLKSEINVYRILSAITSLEALLSDGSTEINFKIRLRVAKLLSLFDLNALEVSENIGKAYNLRSKLVHGSEFKDGGFSKQHTHEILNYNRLCLLIFLQLENIKSKKDLIKLIDNSFIDAKSGDELKKLVAEKVKIPILNPFSIQNKTIQSQD
ncbi:MAG: hypothetical protein IPN76_17735 [Saprospiraceae bacterium]|nr:hypothetical protein [Saprospiraceae bacterium]